MHPLTVWRPLSVWSFFFLFNFFVVLGDETQKKNFSPGRRKFSRRHWYSVPVMRHPTQGINSTLIGVNSQLLMMDFMLKFFVCLE